MSIKKSGAAEVFHTVRGSSIVTAECFQALACLKAAFKQN